MTGYETLMAAVLGRLKAAPATWGLGVVDVRRAHRTTVPRAGTAVHLIGGTDRPQKGSGLCRQRDFTFTVSLFVRSDSGEAATDALKVEVMRRLSPDTTAYAASYGVMPGAITPDEEIADSDSIRIDMDFTGCYPASEWTLS